MSSISETTLSSLTSTASTASTTSSTSSSTTLDMEDFLSLLTAELEYQDPLNPSDNSELIQQTAAFSQITALTDMADSMETLSNYALSINNMQALSFLGRTVTAEGNIIEFDGSSSVDLNFTTADESSSIEISIYDTSGNEVNSMTINGADAGNLYYSWDGTDSDGNTVDAGNYYFTVSAVDSDGNAVSASTYAIGSVTNVRYENGSTYLTVGGQEITLSDVLRIYE